MLKKSWMKIFVLCFCFSLASTNLLAEVDGSDAPENFTKFTLGDHGEFSELLNNYMWYHFKTRNRVISSVFALEYLSTADLWLSGTIHPKWEEKVPVQDLYRRDLLTIKMSPDGYINTHQHFSHSHEQAWPFPLWKQGNPGAEEGGAAGWHFNYSGFGWTWDYYFSNEPDSRFAREKAIEGWKLKNLESFGIDKNKWQLKSTGKSPSISMPTDILIDAFNAPYLQLRWNRSTKNPPSVLPYVEWKRAQDEDFSDKRRVYFDFSSGNPEYEEITHATHSMMTMYSHPLWNGKIKELRISLAPGESDVDFEIDSFFTVYDTRQSINNPIYIMSCWNYFKWTGDIDFLKSRINQMREALKFQQSVLGGLKFNHIRNSMPGHDGVSGITQDAKNGLTINYGHGIGSNYWDIVSFGWDDLYATNQYYKSTLVMADVEEAISENPQWGILAAHFAFEPKVLRKHAEKVKKVANRKFWNKKNGRFNGCIDKKGKPHDYGFTFLNLDSIWYGLANKNHSKQIMDWITGKRIVKSDTSQGDDIYNWRFGPRATTLRNIDWYQFVWTAPQDIPWGGQVQDGGAVLGFTFYDLWARLHVLGADNAWQRLTEILEWEKDIWKKGGYRNYYGDGLQGTTLQGGGTAGGLGIDCEFFESSLMPSIITYGFLGIDPQANSLKIAPKLPDACPEMSIENLLYRNVRMDITASNDKIVIVVKDSPIDSINLVFTDKYREFNAEKTGSEFAISKVGSYVYLRK